jgi:hypothetical protein
MFMILLAVAFTYVFATVILIQAPGLDLNAKTAQREIKNGYVRLVTYGIADPDADANHIAFKYGFRRYHMGCVMSQDKNIWDYQVAIDKYLDQRNGAGWRERYEHELDSFRKKSQTANY